MYSFDCQSRVRYADTDKMGYLYYGNYAILYEIGRVETMRSLGLTYQEMEDHHHIMMPVAHVESRFILPAKYDELLTIRTTIEDRPGRIITFINDIFNQEMQLIHKAVVKLFFIDMKTNKNISCPSFLADKLLPYFE